MPIPTMKNCSITLNEKSKEKTMIQYEDAIKNNQFVIFIRDNENKNLCLSLLIYLINYIK